MILSRAGYRYGMANGREVMDTSWPADKPRVAACRACGYPTLAVNYCAVCTSDVLANPTYPDPGVTRAA